MKTNTKIITLSVVVIMIVLGLGLPLVYSTDLMEEPASEPEAKINVDKYHASLNEKVSFDGTRSKGDIVKWLWDFDDGVVSFEPKLEHVFPRSDYYKVSLTVIDSHGKTDIALLNVSVQNEAYREDASGSNLIGTRNTNDWAYMDFMILAGISKPTIYANWTVTAKGAEIRLTLWSQEAGSVYYEYHTVLNEELVINTVIQPDEIFGIGRYQMEIGCIYGKVDEYLMEVEVKY